LNRLFAKDVTRCFIETVLALEILSNPHYLIDTESDGQEIKKCITPLLRVVKKVAKLTQKDVEFLDEENQEAFKGAAAVWLTHLAECTVLQDDHVSITFPAWFKKPK
jgi:hypothetical protein